MTVLAVLKSTVDWKTMTVTVLASLSVEVEVPDTSVEFGSVTVAEGMGPEVTVTGEEVTVTVSGP